MLPPRHHALLALLALALLLSITSIRLPLAADSKNGAAGMVQFSVPSGAYERDVRIGLRLDGSEATIIYTTNGRFPTPGNATPYTAPFYLTANPTTLATIQARALWPDGTLGEVTTAVYTVGLQTTLPIVSIVTEPENLRHETSGLFANPEERGLDWERPLTLSYIDENGRLAIQTPAGFRIHGLTSRRYEKKSLRLYFRQAYGQARLDYPLFAESDVTAFKRLVLHGGGQDYPAQRPNGTLLRNALMARLAQQVNGFATHSRPVLLLINGERWGIYQLRERIDEDYLLDHFGIEPDDSDVAHWDNLDQFLDSHDLSNPEHFAYVQTQIDLANFIDYNILQMYAANTDWPNNNQTRFRDHGPNGRWRWLFWDSDFAFGLAPNSRVDTDMVERVLVRERADIAGGAKLLRKLMQNPTFAAQFHSRANELLATILQPSHVIAEIDQLAAELAPNIHHETERWPGGGTWTASVADMKAFAEKRPFIFQQNLQAHFQSE